MRLSKPLVVATIVVVVVLVAAVLIAASQSLFLDDGGGGTVTIPQGRVSALDWILAEFVRLHHNVSANEAQKLVEELVTRVAPVVQDFDGFLKLLNPKLGATDQALVLLYQRGPTGAEFQELEQWVNPKSRKNLRRTLHALVHAKAFAHQVGDRYTITRSGQQDVERRKLVQPA